MNSKIDPKTLPPLKKCPFCGSCGVFIFDGLFDVNVHCVKATCRCTFDGNWTDSVQKAANKWNNRKKHQ